MAWSDISYVFETSRATGPDRLVLLCAAYHANPMGNFWQSVCTFARETRLDRNTVRRALRRLVEDGEIEIKGVFPVRGGLITVYQMAGPMSARRQKGETPKWCMPETPEGFPRGFRAILSEDQSENAEKGGPSGASCSPPGGASYSPPGGASSAPRRAAQLAPPGGAARTPSDGVQRAPGGASYSPPGGASSAPRIFSEPSLNLPPHSAQVPREGGAAPLEGGAPPRSVGDLTHPNTPPGEASPGDPADQPVSPEQLSELIRHLRAVRQGRELPNFVGPDYRPDEDPLADQVAKAEQQKQALAEFLNASGNGNGDGKKTA